MVFTPFHYHGELIAGDSAWRHSGLAMRVPYFFHHLTFQVRVSGGSTVLSLPRQHALRPSYPGGRSANSGEAVCRVAQGRPMPIRKGVLKKIIFIEAYLPLRCSANHFLVFLLLCFRLSGRSGSWQLLPSAMGIPSVCLWRREAKEEIAAL